MVEVNEETGIEHFNFNFGDETNLENLQVPITRSDATPATGPIISTDMMFNFQF